MVTIMKNKMSDQDVSFIEDERVAFHQPANDNLSALAVDEIETIANDNDEGFDQREIGISLNSPNDDADAYVLDKYQPNDDLQELDFSQDRLGTRGYLSEDIAVSEK